MKGQRGNDLDMMRWDSPGISMYSMKRRLVTRGSDALVTFDDPKFGLETKDCSQ